VPIMNQSIKIRLVAGFAAVIGLIGSAGPVTAWGPEGHAIISHIAAARLSAEARQQLIALLGSPSAETMAAGANWADEVRRDRPMTAPWHYVNIELGSGGYMSSRDCADGACVVAQIKADSELLASGRGAVAERTEALKFLLHFVGDLHQPLHCADRHDRGGNEVAVALDGELTNLHRIWDTEEVRALGPDAATVAIRLNSQITPAEAAAWSNGTVGDWASQSFAIARDRIYARLPAEVDGSVKMSGRNIRQNAEIAALQLKRAGIRLAAILNRTIGNPGGNQAHRNGYHATSATSALPLPAAVISPGEAARHLEQTVTVRGRIAQVHATRTGTIFLDFDARYPNNDFTGVIFRDDASNFQDVERLTGQIVDVTGRVQLYRGKPEIVLRSPSQISATGHP
jgi:hypothetical protein